jgi:hypothetical protein
MRNAWLDLTEAAQSSRPPPPQNPPRDEFGSARLFVHVRGTVAGPGSYGHLGVSIFGLTVDSILRVALPAPDDCR